MVWTTNNLGQHIIITATTTINQPHMIQTFKGLNQSKMNIKKINLKLR